MKDKHIELKLWIFVAVIIAAGLLASEVFGQQNITKRTVTLDSLSSRGHDTIWVTNGIGGKGWIRTVGDTLFFSNVGGVNAYSKTQSDDKYLSKTENILSNKLTATRPNSYPDQDSIGPIFVFIFDSRTKNLIENYGDWGDFPDGGFMELFGDEKFCISVNVNDNLVSPGDEENMSLNQLISLQNQGYEMMRHLDAINHSTYTEAEADAYIKVGKDKHAAYGLIVNSANYLTGYTNIAFRSAVRKYYNAACVTEYTFADTATNSYYKINRRPINQYALIRNSLDSGIYNNWIKVVDRGITENALVIFYGHPYLTNYYTLKKDDNGNIDTEGEYTWKKISDLLDYIRSKSNYGEKFGPRILTMSEMLNDYGNVIEVGANRMEANWYYDLDYFRVSKLGEVGSRKLDKISINEKNLTIGHTIYGNTGLNQLLIGNYSGNKSSGNYMTSVGIHSGGTNTGHNLTSIGYYSGDKNTGASVVAIGTRAGESNVGDYLIAVGYEAGQGHKKQGGTFLGYQAGRNDTGEYVTGVGYQSLRLNKANSVTGVGSVSGYENTGNNGSFLGSGSGYTNTGANATFMGYQAGRQNSGTGGTGFGYNALYLNSGARVMSFGYDAGRSNTANDCVFLGYQAGYNNTKQGVFLVEHRTLSASNPLIKGFFATGSLITGVPATAVADTEIGNGRMSFYLDEVTNKLMVRVRYSDGSYATGEIALTKD